MIDGNIGHKVFFIDKVLNKKFCDINVFNILIKYFFLKITKYAFKK